MIRRTGPVNPVLNAKRVSEMVIDVVVAAELLCKRYHRILGL